MKYKLHIYLYNLPAWLCLLFRTVVPYFTTLFFEMEEFHFISLSYPVLIIKCVNFLLINTLFSYYGIKFGCKECGPLDGHSGPQ